MKARLTRWLESPAVVREILDVDDVELLAVTTGGHHRKLIVAAGSRRFVCHLGLRRRTLDHLDRLLRVLDSHQVDTQPILARGLRVRDLLRRGAFFLVLGYLPGEVAAGVRSHHELEAIAANLARLHGVPLESALVLFPRAIAMASGAELAARAEPTLATLRARPGFELDAPLAQRWLDRVARLPREALRPALLHGDPHGGNVVLNEGRAWWIDTEDYRIGIPGLELTECLLASYCGMDDARQRVFASAYLRHATPAIVGTWERWGSLLASVALLERTRRMLGHAARELSSGDPELAGSWHAAAQDHWLWFRRFATETPVAADSWTAVASVAPKANRPSPFFPVPY